MSLNRATTLKPFKLSHEAVTEIEFLLPVDQFDVLQSMADAEATTVANLIRRILNESLSLERRQQIRPGGNGTVTRPNHPGDDPSQRKTDRPTLASELSAEVWEFLESTRSALDEARDESAVASLARQLAVPLLGEMCTITLPGHEPDPTGTWQSSKGNAAYPAEGAFVLELHRVGCLAGALTLLGRAAIDRYAFHRTARLFAETVSRALDRAAVAETRQRGFYSEVIPHELRNSLTTLVYGAEIIRRIGLDSQAGQKAYKRVDRQITHLHSVLEGLLDLQKAQHGKLTLRTQCVDLKEIFKHASESIESLLSEKSHRLTVRVGEETGLLRADPVRLEQVLVNLLTNAARYTEPGGELSVTANRRGEIVTIRVRDNGVGMSADLLSHVFDSFVQGEHGRGGLGIGLTLVRRLVELQGGRIGVTSNGPGCGCEFVIDLPRGEVPEPAHSLSSDSIHEKNGT